MRMAMSLMIGAEMVVMRRRMDERKIKTTPILFPPAMSVTDTYVTT